MSVATHYHTRPMTLGGLALAGANRGLEKGETGTSDFRGYPISMPVCQPLPVARGYPTTSLER
uniref:Uncharacterized protein n=1 Tax=Candidatus Kentrum sp. MB TaxID=2138164 RepID=A0A450XGD2_9GAMM|nr:MAG: hypothetical protein BECKMB1821G_GA0114241_10355 [Candidatus Kentron sp. MB]VFK32557.1 MAG: hypothetical protein BECKMB1821I_GA0114274_103430 [Candidatus Kentron sp. MB]VFK75977.1 MAG: hypothetical protein BECKMB1821H_GA0114242_103730 [Candidatus Kentron sp. MB]